MSTGGAYQQLGVQFVAVDQINAVARSMAANLRQAQADMQAGVRATQAGFQQVTTAARSMSGEVLGVVNTMTTGVAAGIVTMAAQGVSGIFSLRDRLGAARAHLHHRRAELSPPCGAEIEAATVSLSRQSGVLEGQLVQGMTLASARGFTLAQSQALVSASTKVATATGYDFQTVLLGNMMYQQGEATPTEPSTRTAAIRRSSWSPMSARATGRRLRRRHRCAATGWPPSAGTSADRNPARSSPVAAAPGHRPPLHHASSRGCAQILMKT